MSLNNLYDPVIDLLPYIQIGGPVHCIDIVHHHDIQAAVSKLFESDQSVVSGIGMIVNEILYVTDNCLDL